MPGMTMKENMDWIEKKRKLVCIKPWEYECRDISLQEKNQARSNMVYVQTAILYLCHGRKAAFHNGKSSVIGTAG